jgi:tripartite-type tricarboxylate transporter receptor subunit TctC
MKRNLLIVIAAILCNLPAAASYGQSDFYKDKPITIIVGFTAGGIVDLWARSVAQHLGKQIPGNPAIIVQNMGGGGSLTAANHLYNVAKPDGLTLGMVSAALSFEQVMKRPEVKFDWARFGWIGSPVRNFEILSVRSDTPLKNTDDIRSSAQPPRCGSTGTGNTAHYFPQFLEEALGLKFQMVAGYQGTKDIELAFERGEVNCYASTKEIFEREPARSWRKSRFIRVLVQGGQKRHPEFPDVPTIYELMDKNKTPDAMRRLATILLSPTSLGRPLIAPPGLPADRLKLLRESYAKMLNDRDFLADAKKRDWEIEKITGEDLEAMAKKAVSQPPETADRLKKVLE